jgi:hypothetical protein
MEKSSVIHNSQRYSIISEQTLSIPKHEALLYHERFFDDTYEKRT